MGEFWGQFLFLYICFYSIYRMFWPQGRVTLARVEKLCSSLLSFFCAIMCQVCRSFVRFAQNKCLGLFFSSTPNCLLPAFCELGICPYLPDWGVWADDPDQRPTPDTPAWCISSSESSRSATKIVYFFVALDLYVCCKANQISYFFVFINMSSFIRIKSCPLLFLLNIFSWK